MPRRAPFVNKLLNRLDRIDREAIERYVLSLVHENEELANLLSRVPAGVMLVDANGKAVYRNAQASAWLGLAGDPHEALEDPAGKVRDSEIQRALRELLKKRSRDPQVRDVHALVPQEKDLRIVYHPGEEEGGSDSLIFLDLTAEKKRESEALRSRRHESLVRLASGVAHEIGNPLNSIHIHLGLLRKELAKTPDESRKVSLETLSVVESETKRLDRIVRNFLKATRKPPLRFRQEDLNDIIREAVSFFKPELGSHAIRLEFREDRNLPSFLMDRQRLYEVFVNLIKNAMEAMPEGGTIRISVSYQGKAVMVRIKDQGTGIAEEDLPHIFDAYFTTKQEGSGLGLMMVYEAVTEHGGRIEVESPENKGTTFTILLPVRQPKLQLFQE